MLMNIIGKAMMTALFGTEELEKSDKDDEADGGEDLPTDWDPGWRHCPTCGQKHEEPARSEDAPLAESGVSREIR
jgi:hypothetical protein